MIIGISGKIGHGKDTVATIKRLVDAGVDDSKIIEFINGKHAELILLMNYKNWETRRFSDKIKQFVGSLLGCNIYSLEDREFKERELGEEWTRSCVCSMQYVSPKSNGRISAWYASREEAEKKLKELRGDDLFLYTDTITPRELMQIIGTEAGRNLIHPNIWVNALMADYKYRGSKRIQEGDVITANTFTDYPNWIIPDVRFPNEAEAIKKRGGMVVRVNRIMEKEPPDVLTFEEHESETALDDYDGFDVVIENTTLEKLVVDVRNSLSKFSLF